MSLPIDELSKLWYSEKRYAITMAVYLLYQPLPAYHTQFESLISPRQIEVCCDATNGCNVRGAKIKQGHRQTMNFRNCAIS